LAKLLKEPLVQFLLIGACIYAVYALFGATNGSETDRTVYISEERVASLAVAWEKRWNRAPTEQELAGLVRAWLREDILYREAMAMGLDSDDHIIRRRLAQKLEFLTNDLAQLQEPTAAELDAFFSDHKQQFKAPDRISFVQVFFNPDTRGDATLSDAEQALVDLSAAGEPDPARLEIGDRLMINDFYSGVTAMDIRRVMGSDFADAVMQLDPGKWHGPVLSGFGTHLVYVFGFQRAPEPELADVRPAVIAEWQRLKTEEFNGAFYASAKDRYEIVIEGSPDFVDSVLRESTTAVDVEIPDGAPGS
jgi:hypothetical protein